MNGTRIRTQLGKRGAIVGAGVAGFLVGAGGFVAAQIDDSASAETEVEVEAEHAATAAPSSTSDDSVPSSSVSPTVVDLAVPAVTTDDSSSVPDTTTDDSSTSSVPAVTTDDSSTSSVPTTTDDSSTSSVPTTTDDSSTSSVPAVTTDDSSSSSVPTTTDDSSSSSVPAALPSAFTRSYQSFGGSIGVTWTGTAFVLDSVSPAAGFHAEIEDQSWDRIRVDFEGDDDDARIEVRMDDGQIRVRVD